MQYIEGLSKCDTLSMQEFVTYYNKINTLLHDSDDDDDDDD